MLACGRRAERASSMSKAAASASMWVAPTALLRRIAACTIASRFSRGSRTFAGNGAEDGEAGTAWKMGARSGSAPSPSTQRLLATAAPCATGGATGARCGVAAGTEAAPNSAATRQAPASQRDFRLSNPMTGCSLQHRLAFWRHTASRPQPRRRRIQGNGANGRPFRPPHGAQRSRNASLDLSIGRSRKLSTERSPMRTSALPVIPGNTESDLPFSCSRFLSTRSMTR